MLGMKNHFDISGCIEIREVEIAGVACNFMCLVLTLKLLQISMSAYSEATTDIHE